MVAKLEFIATIYDVLSKNLYDRRDHPALILGDVQITYGELVHLVDTVASWLYHNTNIQRGDRVGIHMLRSIEEIIATFAIARIGAVFVNLTLSYPSLLQPLQHIIDDCGIQVLFTDQRRAKEIVVFHDLMDKLGYVIVLGKTPTHPKMISWHDIQKEEIKDLPTVTIDKDLAALMYTSGSTGKPKGVMLTHLNIVQGTKNVIHYLKNTPDDRVLGIPPISFLYGLQQITTMFFVGGTVVLQPVNLPNETVKTILARQVTGLATVPPALIQLMRYLNEIKTEIPSLRYVTSTGASIPQTTLELVPKLLPKVDFYLLYGMTEAARTYVPPELFREKMGAMGRAMPNTEVFVINEQTGRCGPGEQGELVQRGSSLSVGYWNDTQKTEERFRPCKHIKHLIKDERVLFSGDIVRIDEDGILWYVSRTDALINVGGYRVGPNEVEMLVYESGLVGHVVAFGVDDKFWNQVVHAVVSSPNDKPVDIEVLMSWCHRNIPHYLRPQKIYYWEGDMPRTSSGKIDRRTIIDRYAHS